MDNNDVIIEKRKLTAEELAERKAYDDGEYQRQVDMITEQRQLAYQRESDPIFMEAQRDSSRTLDEWNAKVEEIKARYPYPS